MFRIPHWRCPVLLTVALGLSVSLAAATRVEAPYLDPAQPLDARVRDLVSRMTLDEKAAEMMNSTPGVPRLGIPKYDWWNEALHGVARAGEATVFPQAIGLAAMWDDGLMQEIGGAIGTEARAKNNAAPAQGHAGERHYGLTFWTPNINIFRDPRWGRGQETYGEDPWLTSRLGVGFVRGLQGSDPRYLLAAACAKHFAVHSGPETLRHHFDATPPEADFYETYTPAFEALVEEAHVAGVMTAYNSLYGKPCAINPTLYALLDRWGFDGYVTSDCGAIGDLSRTYRVAKDDAEAEALSINAGLCTRCGANPPALAEAVKRGLIREDVIDRQLGRLLRTMFRLGIFDPPALVPFSKIPFSENNSPAHAELALRAAREAMVLLKNDGVLPLDPARLKRLAVIGPNAASETALLGNYNGTPSAPITVLAGLRAALGDKVVIDCVRGCDYADEPGGVRVIPRTALNSDADAGLMAEYFPNRDLAGAAAIHRRDRIVDLDFSRGKPPTRLPAENISARWTGNLLTTVAGHYKLVITGRGGFRLKLDGRTLIDAWTPEEKTRSIVQDLPDNATLPLSLEYFQGDGPARISLQWETPAADAGYADALTAVRRADAVIFVGGISAQLEGEEMKVDYAGFSGGDRTEIELPPVQEKLLELIGATGKPLVVVNMSGSAIALPWAADHANAILQAWYAGQAGGAAVADVLLGRTNPAGRLPVTFYRATSDLPPFEDYSMANRTYRYFRGTPLYAFGHGLSYTTYEYGKPVIAKLADPTGEPSVRVTLPLTNTGARDGDEVVQVYVTPPDAREREALGAFARVHLVRGEIRTVNLMVPPHALRRWSTQQHGYVIPAGTWKLAVGASSSDLRQVGTFEVK